MEMNAITQIVRNAMDASTHNENDYIGDDGLLHCGTCHEPKQHLVHD